MANIHPATPRFLPDTTQFIGLVRLSAARWAGPKDNLGAPHVTSLLTEVAGSSAYGTCLGREKLSTTMEFDKTFFFLPVKSGQKAFGGIAQGDWFLSFWSPNSILLQVTQ